MTSRREGKVRFERAGVKGMLIDSGKRQRNKWFHGNLWAMMSIMHMMARHYGEQIELLPSRYRF